MPSRTYVAQQLGAFAGLLKSADIAGYRLEPHPPFNVRDRYFDTEDGELLRRGMCLRVRDRDGDRRALLRPIRPGDSGATVEVRLEGANRLDSLEPLRDELVTLTGTSEPPELRLLLSLRQYRTPRAAYDGDRLVCLLSFDVVVYELPDGPHASNELDVELAASGTEADLNAFDPILRAEGLSVVDRTKVERGIEQIPRTLTEPLLLLPHERDMLEHVISTGDALHQRRARVLLLDARGFRSSTIANQLGLSTARVRHWKARFREARLEVFDSIPSASPPAYTVSELVSGQEDGPFSPPASSFAQPPLVTREDPAPENGQVPVGDGADPNTDDTIPGLAEASDLDDLLEMFQPQETGTPLFFADEEERPVPPAPLPHAEPEPSAHTDGLAVAMEKTPVEAESAPPPFPIAPLPLAADSFETAGVPSSPPAEEESLLAGEMAPPDTKAAEDKAVAVASRFTSLFQPPQPPAEAPPSVEEPAFPVDAGPAPAAVEEVEPSAAYAQPAEPWASGEARRPPAGDSVAGPDEVASEVSVEEGEPYGFSVPETADAFPRDGQEASLESGLADRLPTPVEDGLADARAVDEVQPEPAAPEPAEARAEPEATQPEANEPAPAPVGSEAASPFHADAPPFHPDPRPLTPRRQPVSRPSLRRPRLNPDDRLVSAAHDVLAYHIGQLGWCAANLDRDRGAYRLYLTIHRVRIALEVFAPVLPHATVERLHQGLHRLAAGLGRALELEREGTPEALARHERAMGTVRALLEGPTFETWIGRAQRLVDRLAAAREAGVDVPDDAPTGWHDFVTESGDRPGRSRLRHLLGTALWSRVEGLMTWDRGGESPRREDAYSLALACSGIRFVLGLAERAAPEPVRRADALLEGAEASLIRLHRGEAGDLDLAWTLLRGESLRSALADVLRAL